MKILVVSDTHGKDEELEKVLLKEEPFDMLIHCGDVEGREFFIEAAAGCPCCIVAGNNDFFSDLNREEELVICGKRIMVTHGHMYGVSMNIYGVTEEAADRGCDLVLFGHTHKPIIETMNNVLAVNPGSLSYPRQAGRRPSYAILTITGSDVIPEIRYL